MHSPADPRAWEQFRSELLAATARNVWHPVVREWRSAREAMAWLRARLPYRFDASRTVASLWDAVPRGWGACATCESQIGLTSVNAPGCGRRETAP